MLSTTMPWHWRGEKLSEWKDHFIRDSAKYDFPIHRAIRDLTDAQRDLLEGEHAVCMASTASSSIIKRRATSNACALASRYRQDDCPDCGGGGLGLKPEGYVKVGVTSMNWWMPMTGQWTSS